MMEGTRRVALSHKDSTLLRIPRTTLSMRRMTTDMIKVEDMRRSSMIRAIHSNNRPEAEEHQLRKDNLARAATRHSNKGHLEATVVLTMPHLP